jgi:hypothetical protein
MTTTYPTHIDGYSNIRIVRDGIEEVLARDHNDIRSAIVATEQTLGLNPQGLYGTVVARLDQADTDFGELLVDFGEHVNGVGYRHITNHIDYPGSGSKTFADGYALVASRLGSTLNEIVTQLGSITGDTKVGATVFDTFNNKFRFPTGSVSSQVEMAGDLLDEVSTILENELSGFVISGMQVSYDTPASVSIASGQICLGGRIRSYVGGTYIHSGIGLHRLCATISGVGNVTIKDASTVDEFVGVGGNESTVMLRYFTETGIGWANDSEDLRRFGMYANNKPYFTVGEDGHGADFTSIQSALKYIDFLQNTTNGAGINRPYKIMIVGDITVSGNMPIVVPAGIEIDGGGHTVSWSDPVVLFDLINSDYSILKDIRAIYTGALGIFTSFARISASGSATMGQKIINCTQSGANALYFVFILDDGSGISNVTVSGCSAEAKYGHVTSGSGTPTISFSRIIGNRFYQTTSVVTGEADIRIGSNSIVANNIIQGGFNKGIEVFGGVDILISDNKINGGDGLGTALMGTGIDAKYRCLVTGNFINGVASYGIYLNGATNTYIVGNLVDNSLDSAAGMVGIADRPGTPPVGLAANNFIIDNCVICPGDCGIRTVSSVIGNFILGKDTLATTAGIILLFGKENLTVANNVVKNVNGIGLDCGLSTYLCVHGNMFINDRVTGGVDGATAAIVNFGDYSTIVENVILAYGVDTGSVLIQPVAISDHIVISRNSLTLCNGTAIDVNDSQFVLVEGNFMTNGAKPLSAILNYGNQSMIANNFIRGFGANPLSTMISASVITSGPCVVFGNSITSCQGDAIDGYNTQSQNIIGNILVGSGLSANGIKNIGAYSLIANNVIREYGSGGDGISVTGINCAVIGNTVILQNGDGINLLSDSYGMVTGNYIDQPTAFGIVTLSSSFLSICCNFINLAGSNGISINDSPGTLTANNFIFRPVSRGIALGGTSTYNSICGNQIRGCSNGIYLRNTAHYCLVSCNMIVSHANDAISIINSSYHTITSNTTLAPSAPGANGIDISGSDNVLLVGNRCEAVSPDKGFVIDVQGGGASNTVTASGNLAIGGDLPTGFSANNNIDSNSCRHIS